MIEYKQEFMEFQCPREKEFTRFVTHTNDPKVMICCSCGFTTTTDTGVTKSEINKEKRNLKHGSNKAFYEHLLSLQTK